jgi:uncharacterized coiled-coil DUF342 family protein
MRDDDKLINAVIDLGIGLKALQNEMIGMRKDMNKQLGDVNQRLDDLNNRVGKLEKQQVKTNHELGEMRLTFIQLAGTIEKSANFEKRIHKLERIVFK